MDRWDKQDHKPAQMGWLTLLGLWTWIMLMFALLLFVIIRKSA